MHKAHFYEHRENSQQLRFPLCILTPIQLINSCNFSMLLLCLVKIRSNFVWSNGDYNFTNKKNVKRLPTQTLQDKRLFKSGHPKINTSNDKFRQHAKAHNNLDLNVKSYRVKNQVSVKVSGR